MPQVDFYILEGSRQPEHLVCQLTGKACQQGLEVQIHTVDRAAAETIDQRLWTFSDISFIPHALYTGDGIERSPVLISWDNHPASHTDILMNLTGELPDDPQNFARIIEIIPANDHARQQARQRYRSYRERGYELETHNIG